MSRIRSLVALLVLALIPVPTPALASGDAKRFWFVFLESGKKTPDDKEAVAAMQRGHIDNFKRLFAEKKLFAAGPLRDPSRLKRGIVVARAASKAELLGYFQPDAYVRDGYMTANAVPAIVRKGLSAEGIDAEGVEEVRIVLLSRPSAKADLISGQAGEALLQSLLDKGTIGAWYTLEDGPVAEVLFARTTDDRMLEESLSPYPALAAKSATMNIWGQWLSKGVVK
jgi:uncharacterized protein YciI